MLLEVDPGQGDALPAGGRIQVANTNPDVNPDEVLSTLDSDTRPYLRMLVSGAGQGLRGGGDDLAERSSDSSRFTATWPVWPVPEHGAAWLSSG